jgi:hypothetical protein
VSTHVYYQIKQDVGIAALEGHDSSVKMRITLREWLEHVEI